MIEGTANVEHLVERDTYVFSVEVSATNIKLAAASGSFSLAQFVAELMYAQVLRLIDEHNA